MPALSLKRLPKDYFEEDLPDSGGVAVAELSGTGAQDHNLAFAHDDCSSLVCFALLWIDSDLM